MQTRSLVAIVDALNKANVRYLIVGGLAVVAHGYVRFTADLDVVLDLEQGNVGRAVSALATLNYTPRAPVPLAAFADPAQRAQWVADKGLTVFSLWSADHSATEVDLFVEEPLDFAAAYDAAVTLEIGPDVVASFASLDDLIDETSRRASRGPRRHRATAAATEGDHLMPDHDPADLWPRGWDAHRVAQLTRLAGLPLSKKLEWLEAAHAAVTHLRLQRPRAVTAADTTDAPDLPRTRESR